ncbi:MAG: phosphotransferase [Myxococcales bacterium]|nr:phosphotransferase [Myxococcales bacterium]
MGKLGPVREAHRFDEAALHAWLVEHVRGGDDTPFTVGQFDAGQSNPTFLLTWPDARAVLRKKPPGELLPKAHAVEREARVMMALQDTAVPVPRVLGQCEDPSVIGTPFFVMEFLQGRILFDARLPELSPDQRTAHFASLVGVLAALHTVDVDAVGLSDYGRRGNYFERQIGTWTKQYRRAETERIEEMEQVMAWLADHVPDDDSTTLVHGDFRIDNVVFHPDDARVLGVLDWELSTLGHPMADLAYSCLPFLMDTPYHPAIGSLSGPESGIPTMEEHVAAYCALTGRDGIPDLPFYLSFSMFRIAAILQGVYARGIAGNASSTRALLMGAMARKAAEGAWRIAQGR